MKSWEIGSVCRRGCPVSAQPRAMKNRGSPSYICPDSPAHGQLLLSTSTSEIIFKTKPTFDDLRTEITSWYPGICSVIFSRKSNPGFCQVMGHPVEQYHLSPVLKPAVLLSFHFGQRHVGGYVVCDVRKYL